jgi:hypothetical protein
MNLNSIIEDGSAVIAMNPEDLALAVLRSLNASDENYARRGQRAPFSFTNYCNQQAALYASTPQDQCARAIGTAFQHLVNIGMLIPNPHGNPFGWFMLTDRAKAIKSTLDYEHYRHASRYPRGAIHPAIEQNTYSEFMKGDYDTAVFKAFKTVEDGPLTVTVRGGITELMGVRPFEIHIERKRVRGEPPPAPITWVEVQAALPGLPVVAVNPATQEVVLWAPNRLPLTLRLENGRISFLGHPHHFAADGPMWPAMCELKRRLGAYLFNEVAGFLNETEERVKALEPEPARAA